MPLIRRDIEAMPILYEMHTNRLSRAEKANAWCYRKFRAFKRSSTTKIIIAVLLMGIFTSMLFSIVILLQIPSIPSSEPQSPKVKDSPALGDILQKLKQKLEPLEQWTTHKTNSEREDRQRRAVKEVDYSWPTVVTVFLVCVMILFAVVIALTILWLLKECRSRACIGNVRKNDLGGHQRANQDPEEQGYGPGDSWGTSTMNWHEDVYTPASDTEFSVLRYDQFQPEHDTSSTGSSATPFDMKKLPISLSSQDHPAPVSYSEPLGHHELISYHESQGYGTSIKDSVAYFVHLPVSSSYSGHAEQLTSEAIAPIGSLPNSRREQSQSLESSNSGIADPTQRLLDDTRIPRYKTDELNGRTHSTIPMNGESISRAAPGVVVFKNLSGNDFTEDRLLEMEEGRIFWHC